MTPLQTSGDPEVADWEKPLSGVLPTPTGTGVRSGVVRSGGFLTAVFQPPTGTGVRGVVVRSGGFLTAVLQPPTGTSVRSGVFYAPTGTGVRGGVVPGADWDWRPSGRQSPAPVSRAPTQRKTTGRLPPPPGLRQTCRPSCHHSLLFSSILFRKDG